MSSNDPIPAQDTQVQEPQAADNSVHDLHTYFAMKDVADAYQVPMDNNAINQWVDAHRGGQHTDAVQAFTNYAKQMSMGLYPTLAPQIQNGLPVRALMEPYRLVAQNVLGPDTQINWSQPHWNKAISGQVDPTTNRAAPMSLEAWRQNLMSDPVYGYQNTQAAMDQTDAFLSQLNGIFHGQRGQ